MFTEEIFKNGVIRRRIAEVSVKSAKTDKSERGSVNATEITFKAKRSASLNNEHLGEWLIPAPGTALPTITSALPTGMGAGSTVELVGTGFTGATAVTVGGVAAAMFTVNSATSITLAMPTGSAGSSPIVVTTPVGASVAKAYTRVA
ncbi:hypothetical protein E3T53_04445 [Cryobacterium psychrophilum]|uniref:IPT/TIG domain-containing protein n=2 Tax=Cryobacterium psychrophilum TaxID=41988 RepID=A0A4Y8KQ59_9MICO|nr:hypothetical protein E3T53_04445 [Cryobacterium psychrophilum]